MSTAVLLSGGRDPALMFTRRKLLESSGYSVVEATTADELIEVFIAGDFDLVILCHTIPEHEKRNVVRAIRDRSPSTPILALTNRPSDLFSFAATSVLSDPSALLSAISELIGGVRRPKTGGYNSQTL